MLDVILGTLYGDPLARAALHEWCVVAGVLRALKGARIGLMGHVLESMYDMHVDITSISSAFGVYVPLLEVEEVVELAQDAGQKAICEKRETIERLFSQPEPGSDPIARPPDRGGPEPGGAHSGGAGSVGGKGTADGAGLLL